MKLERDIYIQHIKDLDKQLLMKRVIDKIEIVINNYTIESTDFLDPYERHLASSILNRFKDIKYFEEGGTSQSERKIIKIFPDYMHENDLESSLTFIRIEGNIQGLNHKDFLGSLLSLGIKREKTGDILVHEDYTDLILKKEVAGFVTTNLDKVANAKVQLTEISKDLLSQPELKYKEVDRFVASLRLDGLLSSIFNLSRQDSINIIKSGKVKVNWEQIEKPSKELSQGDMVSIRGYGRVLLYSIDGMSKKGRVHVRVRILI